MPLDLSILGQATAPKQVAYTWRETVGYALGIGAKRSELGYLYEGLGGPKVYPSFAVIPKFDELHALLAASGADLSMIVYGGERVRLHQPFKPNDTLTNVSKIRGIYDMRMLAVILVESESRDADGELVCESVSTIFVRGAGGFGGSPTPKEPKAIAIPKGTPPDFRIEETTSPEQALLYRLSGDLNPLHADPAFAAKVGFTQGPILHGLCTFGYMIRHAAQGVLAGDAQRLTGFEAQFKKPVWPGDTLVTEGWNVAPGSIALQMKAKGPDREDVVISGAWATYS